MSPYGGAALTSVSGFEGDRGLGLDRDVYGVTALARYEISDALSLNSVTAYRRFRALEVLDADDISIPILTATEDARGKQYSQDLRLGWENGGQLSAFLSIRYGRAKKRSGISSAVVNGRSILGGFIGALPQSIAFPVPLSGLAGQPTANNGDLIESHFSDDGENLFR